MIRNLLYNRTINSDCIASTLYNQTLLYKFIAQHQPKYIIHCGCPFNALYLANFIKENYSAEILHIKNWNPQPLYYLDIIPENQNPHQAFLDKITQNNLENHLVSLNSNAINAAEILKERHLKFDMLISDTLNNDTDYMPLLPLIQKKNLHIRYVGHQKISDIKHEAIFASDHEMPVTYAQGYLITGMDYLSLYDDQPQSTSLSTNTPQINVSVDNFQKTIIDIPQPQQHSNADDAPEMIWTENGFVYADNPNTPVIDTVSQHCEPQDTQRLSEAEARHLRREERRQAREERREQRVLSRNAEQSQMQTQIVSQINNAQDTAQAIRPHHQDAQDLGNSADESENNNDNQTPVQVGISDTRQALRARRLARRMAMVNNS